MAVLLATWAMGIESPDMKVLSNVSIIVFGVMLASYGELKFHIIGFIFQITAVLCESIRLVMVQRLLGSKEFKMDPLVSLYYFAPVCAAMNFTAFMVFEQPAFSLEDLGRVGPVVLLANASIAFALNVSVVLLVKSPSSLSPTEYPANGAIDWQDIVPCSHLMRNLQRHPPRSLLRLNLVESYLWIAASWL